MNYNYKSHAEYLSHSMGWTILLYTRRRKLLTASTSLRVECTSLLAAETTMISIITGLSKNVM